MKFISPLALVLLTIFNCCFSTLIQPSDPLQFCAYLKNVHFNEYLFVSPDKKAPGSKNDRVFTGPRNTFASESQGLWQFVQVEPEKYFPSYIIKSAYYKDDATTLYSASSLNNVAKSKDLRSRVHTYRGNDLPANNVWHLMPANLSENEIRLKIENFKGDLADEEFLIADGELDQGSRNVFTKVSKVGSLIDYWERKADWAVEFLVDCPSYLI